MGLNIYITNIKLNSITSIGSLNIGKTIICKNHSTQGEGSPGPSPLQVQQVSPAHVDPTVLEPQVKPDVNPGQLNN